MKAEAKNKLVNVLLLISFIVSFTISYSNYRYEKIPFDKERAKIVLQETWRPLEEFNNNILEDESNNIPLPPSHIKSKDDFIKHFSTTVSERIAEDFYENLIEEKDDLGMVVRKEAYFGTIYNEGAYVLNSYIKKRRNSEMLIITEVFPNNHGDWNKRRNFYKKNEKGEWTHNHFSGVTWYFYNDSSSET